MEMMIMNAVNKPDDRGENAYDVYVRLFHDRIILLDTEIDDTVASNLNTQLLFLEAEDPQQDIYLHIDSPGGSVAAAMEIYDTIQMIEPDVATVCTGLAGSMAGFLLAAGAKGKRFSLPNAQIMRCSVVGGTQDQAVDIEIQEREIFYFKNKIDDLLATHTDQTLAKIQADNDRDFWISPSEAVDSGLIDRIIDRVEIDRFS
jgi:ATP-dependent Clp protease, protease subunit